MRLFVHVCPTCIDRKKKKEKRNEMMTSLTRMCITKANSALRAICGIHFDLGLPFCSPMKLWMCSLFVLRLSLGGENQTERAK